MLFSGVNLTAPSGDCKRGYYCVSGADKPNPVMLNDTQCPEGSVHPIIGHICPAGHFCPEGSSFPEVCPKGFYQVKELALFGYLLLMKVIAQAGSMCTYHS